MPPAERGTDPALSVVTAAPPTPNGDLHLGHLSGPYAAADIYTRARRLTGHDAVYLTGSDLHQSYVPVKARANGVDPYRMADDYADDIARVFAAIGFAPDACPRPARDRRHRDMVIEFIATLHARGALLPRTGDGLHCGRCDRYLFEAYVSGGCPHCTADSDGNSCEACAQPNTCVDLVDPVCNVCGTPPTRRPYRRLVFPLHRYADSLRAYHARTVMSPQLEALCATMLAAPLPEIPLTHPTDWGIASPVAGFTDQRVYVWAEMVPGYLAALAEALAARGGGDWRAVWDAPESEVVQFFGFDNGYFHTILFPALLMAYDPAIRLPDALLTNEFLHLDDGKFSTSRGHAIWARELLDRVPASAVRFALAHDRPETGPSSFTLDRFRTLVDHELAGRWQSWLDSLADRVPLTGVLPLDDPLPSHRRFLADLADMARQCLVVYSAARFSPRTATRVLVDIVRRATEFAAGQSRLRTFGPSATLDAAVAAETAAARTLAQLAWPVMPEFAEHLWHALGETGSPRWDGVHPVAPGRRLTRTSPFFRPLPAGLEQSVWPG
ncbi:methionine--tRNA ligase [Couchioplanes caeruleus]|uniref:methionine--tRNA ligase n=2 Tax=Couchioplanes caeruleus TaxID=56438 RepID=A0A1K0FW86_9ACTN|nr:class I tRNA ligase family protein [Couchioplanes caeruleus]OJF09338.1 hypothetical protein BG844_38120 [Couchioplanes caeruleus subsp. caeruleus]ROP33552.1 methionyl-tRNA synthetase [Couchioplanes caeruleus]